LQIYWKCFRRFYTWYHIQRDVCIQNPLQFIKCCFRFFLKDFIWKWQQISENYCCQTVVEKIIYCWKELFQFSVNSTLLKMKWGKNVVFSLQDSETIEDSFLAKERKEVWNCLRLFFQNCLVRFVRKSLRTLVVALSFCFKSFYLTALFLRNILSQT